MVKIWISLPRTEVQAYVLVRSKSKFLAAKHLSHNLQRTAKNELKAVFLGRKGLLFLSGISLHFWPVRPTLQL